MPACHRITPEISARVNHEPHNVSEANCVAIFSSIPFTIFLIFQCKRIKQKTILVHLSVHQFLLHIVWPIAGPKQIAVRRSQPRCDTLSLRLFIPNYMEFYPLTNTCKLAGHSDPPPSCPPTSCPQHLYIRRLHSFSARLENVCKFSIFHVKCIKHIQLQLAYHEYMYLYIL